MGSSFFLLRIVGRGRAAEMCMTGERVPAADAYRIGLANHVYARDDLFPAAMAMATSMCAKNNLVSRGREPHGKPQPGAYDIQRGNRGG